MVAINAVAGSSAIGGPLPGATPGSVLFADEQGYLAQDNASLYWDNINKRLGMGTDAPAAPIDLCDGGPVHLKLTPTESTTFFDLKGAGLHYQMRRDMGVLSVQHYTNSPYNIALNPGGTGVGISTLTPAAALDVNVNAATKTGLIVQGAASQSANLTEWRNSSGSNLLEIDSAGQLGIGVDPTSPIHVSVGTDATTILHLLRTGTIDRYLKVNSRGRIDAKSVEAADAAFSFTSGAENTNAGGGERPLTVINQDVAPTSGSSNFSALQLGGTINQTATATGIVRSLYINPTVTSMTGTHNAIETTSGNIVFSGGNVGIGLPNPQQDLEVVGRIRVSETLGGALGRIEFGGNANRHIQPNSAEFQLGTALTDIRFTSTSTCKLESGASDGTTALQLNARTAHTSGNIVEFTNAGAVITTVDFEGKVGVNQSSPDAHVDVAAKDAASQCLHLKGATGQSADLVRITNNSGSQLLSIDKDGKIVGGTNLYLRGSGANDTVITNGSGGYLAHFKAASIVFNESGSAHNFRVEGDTETHLLFVEGGTDRIGIGTSTPAAPFGFDRTLHISGNYGALILETTIGGDHQFLIGANSSGGRQFLDIFDVQSAKRIMTLGADQLIGINEWNPDAMLEIASKAATTTGLHVKGAPAQSANHFEVTNSSGTGVLVVSASERVSIGNASLSSVLNVGGDQVARFNTGGTWQNMDAISTSSSGGANFVMTCADFRLGADLACKLNIIPRNTFQPALGIKQATGGIGKLISIRDSVGTEKMGLTIEGCTKEGAGSGLARFQFDHTVGPASADGDGVGFSLRTENASGSMVDIAYIDAVYDDISADDVSLRFAVRNSSVPAEAMRIDPSGNVGIGTTSPDQELEVSGSGDTYILTNSTNGSSSAYTTYQNSGDANNAWAVGRSNAGQFDIRHSTGGAFGAGTISTMLTITASGHVGVNETAPDAMLEILAKNEATTALHLKQAALPTVAPARITDNSDNDLVVVDEEGKVGIGIVPQYGLHVKDLGGIVATASGDSSVSATSTDANAYCFVTRSAASYRAAIRYYTGGTEDWRVGVLDSSNGLVWKSSGTTERLRVSTGGLVGINESAPGAMLQVNANSTATSTLRLKAAAGQSADLTEWQNSSGTTLRSVDASANIGMHGTDLDLLGGNNVGYRFSDPVSSNPLFGIGSAASPAGYMHLSATGGKNQFYTAARDYHIDSSTHANILYVDAAAGYVGVGTDSPTGVLHAVDGAASLEFSNFAEYSRLILKTTNPLRGSWVEYNTSHSTGFFQAGQHRTGPTFTIQRAWVSNLGSGILGTDFTIDQDGDVGIGGLSAGARLHVEDSNVQIAMKDGIANIWSLQAVDNDFWRLSQSTDAIRIELNTHLTNINGVGEAGAQLQVNADSASTVGANFRGAASQSANLQEWQNSSGTILASVTSAGTVVVGTGSTTSTLSSSSLTIDSGGNADIVIDRGGAGNNGRLQLKTAGTTYGELLLDGSNVLQLRAPETSIYLNTHATGSIIFDTNGEAARFDSSNNLLLGGTTAGGSSVGNLHLFNGTAPTASVANGVILYAKDETASSELYVLDEAGNESKLSPHNEATGEWVFYSKNQKTGKVLHVDMERLVKELDDRLGGGFVREWFDHELN